MTVTPTDHYISPADRYLQHVRAARAVAAGLRDRIVLLGAKPTEPDPDLGYLELGEEQLRVPRVRDVRAFVEKPNVVEAARLCADGALWNTMIACGAVDAFWALGRETAPSLVGVLDSLVPLVGTPEEADAIEYIYRAYPPLSFSSGMLARASGRLLAIELDGVEWSDWGRPERVETTLALRQTRAGSESDYAK